MKFEGMVYDARISNMDEQIVRFKDSTKQMRSVLRIPRLCKQFHDKIKEGNMNEF